MVAVDVRDERAFRVAAARDGDLEAYAWAVHRMRVEPYQLAWEEALNSSDRVVIVCPPGTYKSTTVQFWIEREIGQNPDTRILWIMNSGTQSERRVTEIGRTITSNTTYKQAFPDVEPDPSGQWSKTSLYVKRSTSHPDPTLFGSGWDGPYQGLHVHKIILDDLTDQKDVYSPTTMEMQRVKLRGVIRDRLEDNGSIIAIMTRWSENDLFNTFLEMGFKAIVMPTVADYPWGPTISNRRFPMEVVEGLRRDKGDALFDLTYQCNPLAMSGGIIRREYIQYWDKNNLPESATLSLMTIDPAASTKTWADPTGICVGLFEPKSQSIYVTDLIRKRAEQMEIEKEILRRAQMTSQLVAIGMETVGYQLTFLQRLKRVHNLPVVELPYRTRRQAMHKAIGLDRDKTSRGFYLASRMSQGKVFLPRYLPMFEGVSVTSELLAFPNGKHDECVDVLSFMCALAESYSSGFSPRVRISARW